MGAKKSTITGCMLWKKEVGSSTGENEMTLLAPWTDGVFVTLVDVPTVDA